MNIEQAKAMYQNAGSASKNKKEIEMMTIVNRHPSLGKMRRQMILEFVLWVLFLAVYYDFFDGDRKPLIWNSALVVSVLFLLVHNVLGYVATKNPITGESITQSLGNYLQKLKRFATVSISARIAAIISIMLFFMSGITFDANKYWLIGVLALFAFFQIYLLRRIWGRRIETIESTLMEFTR